MNYSPVRTEVRFLKHEQQCNNNNDNFIYIALIKTTLQITSQTDSTSTIYKTHTHMNALILLTLWVYHTLFSGCPRSHTCTWTQHEFLYTLTPPADCPCYCRQSSTFRGRIQVNTYMTLVFKYETVFVFHFI